MKMRGKKLTAPVYEDRDKSIVLHALLAYYSIKITLAAILL